MRRLVYEAAVSRAIALLATFCACGHSSGVNTPDSATSDAARRDGGDIDAAVDAPAQVSTAELALAGGWAHTCGITASKSVKCWGENDYGQLGTAGTQELHVPTEITGLSNASAIVAANVHTCALSTSGAVSCWGRNTFGEIGDGTTMDRSAPTPVGVGPTNTLAAGTYHTCAVTASGAVSCWGRNDSGQLGDGTLTDHSAAVTVSPLGSVTAVALGTRHSCALLATGGVRCWGENEDGQLGDASRSDRSTPVDVTGLSSGVTAIGAGDNFTCALLAAGTVSCWGGNDRSQLGTITVASSTTPLAVSGIANASALTVGGMHACVLAGGGVKCWGYDNAGQLGDGVSSSTSSATPVDVIGLASGVAQLGAGYSHTCALLSNGNMMCWGDNVRGELGDGTVITRHAPVAVLGF